jgi:hypothetical protein
MSINNNWNNFNNWVEVATQKFFNFANRSHDQDPWVTTFPAYLLNPVVNFSLTMLHTTRTLERAAKTLYYLATAIFSSLAVVFTLGMRKDLNKLCVKQSILLGTHLYATCISIRLTIGNIGAGIQGFLLITKASENEAYYIKEQNNIDKEINNSCFKDGGFLFKKT